MHVRWDAVVDRSLVETSNARLAVQRVARAEPAGNIPVHVQLFGSLASIGTKRSFDFDMPGGAVVRDVLTMLGRGVGEEFLARVLDKSGSKHHYCRLFVDGVAVEDLESPLGTAADPTQIEIILLTGLEGG